MKKIFLILLFVTFSHSFLLQSGHTLYLEKDSIYCVEENDMDNLVRLLYMKDKDFSNLFGQLVMSNKCFLTKKEVPLKVIKSKENSFKADLYGTEVWTFNKLGVKGHNLKVRIKFFKNDNTPFICKDENDLNVMYNLLYSKNPNKEKLNELLNSSKCDFLFLPNNVIIKGYTNKGNAILDSSNFKDHGLIEFENVDYYIYNAFLDLNLINVREIKQANAPILNEESPIAYLLENYKTGKRYIQIYGDRHYFTFIPKDKQKIIDIKFVDNMNLLITIVEDGNKKLLNYQTKTREINNVYSGQDLLKMLKK